MDIISLAGNTIENALKKGCDSAEVFIKTSKRLSVEAKNSKVEALESARDFGMALKVIKRQRLGFSFTTTPDGAEDVVNEAVKAADWTTTDKYVDIPDYKPAVDVLVLDEKIKSIKEDEIINSALLLEKAALDFDVRIKKVRKAEIILIVDSTTILNSKGVNISYDSSYLTAHVTVLASDGRDSQTGWDFAISRTLNDIDFVSVAESASKKAIDLLGARKISSVKVPVIFGSSVASDFLRIFSASLSAEAVQKKRSFLAGKIGENIINPVVNIVDDGLIPWKIGTKPVDDEGVPTSRKVIVSNGSLTGFIHNTYTAKKEGITSTGNAIRGSFRSLPGIDVTNLYIEPKHPCRQVSTKDNENMSGETPDLPVGQPSRLSITVFSEQISEKLEVGSKNENNLIKSVSRGLLILETMGLHTANPVSGDFSIGISGLWIENGQMAYPIKEAVMSGNILKLFNRIEKVGDDLRFYGKVGSPSLLIGEMDISA